MAKLCRIGFLKTYPSLLAANISNISDSKGASHSFEKKELDYDREAAEEASIMIFLWFIVGREGLPPEKIYQDYLIRQMWEQLKEDDEAHEEADDGEPQELVLKNRDRLETWLDTIG